MGIAIKRVEIPLRAGLRSGTAPRAITVAGAAAGRNGRTADALRAATNPIVATDTRA
jgi:hypothetical protein